MAHMIEDVNGKACMAYAGEKPWHGLGTEVSADMTAEEMLKAAGLDWNVGLYSLWTNSRKFGARKTEQGKMLVRETDGKELDIVGPDYIPVQNQEAFRFFKRFIEAGHMRMETAGSLQEGRRIWGLANIQDSFTLAGGDKVTGYLLVSSPHIYGESLQIRFVATRVVCWNTLSMAMREKGQGKWRMLHLQSFDERQIAKAELALGISKSLLGDFKAKAEFLASVRADEKKVSEFTMKLFDKHLLDTLLEVKQAQEERKGTKGAPTLDDLLEGQQLTEKEKEFQRLVAMKPGELDAWANGEMNRAGKKVLQAIVDSPGADMESAKGTWWGALNGVTYVVDHTIGYDHDAMLTSAWLGQRASLKENALDLAVEYAEAQKGSKSNVRTI